MDRRVKPFELAEGEDLTEPCDLMEQMGMEVQSLSMDTALAQSMIGASHIEISENNSGQELTARLDTKLSLGGAQIRFEVGRKKVVNRKIIIHK